MPSRRRKQGPPDWKAVARANGLSIPSAEIDQIAPVLTDLLRECREAGRRDPAEVEPVGTFVPDPGQRG